jgi:Arf-GAP/SH3 domain/ANK repeat/PH domain-containing protein
MVYTCCSFQLSQAKSGKFNPHVHVEYEWNLRQEEMDESDDDLEDKVSVKGALKSPPPFSVFLHCVDRALHCEMIDFGLMT